MAEAATRTCYHEEDTVDHKCFEACATADFKSKGITVSGTCPSKYNTVDKTVTEEQCPDGVTNLRYCAATALNVTIKTKGEAAATFVAAIVGGVAKCTTDKQCPSSYCQNGVCHACGD